jgi:hypothetical protein
MATARALQVYKSAPGYGSNAAVAKDFDVSPEIVREFLTLLDLPPEIQALIDQRKLNLEHGRRLAQFRRARPDLIVQAAEMMLSLSAHDARDLIDHALRNPQLTLSAARDEVLASKTAIRDVFHIMTPLSAEDYAKLQRIAQQRGEHVTALVASIVEGWLDRVPENE